MKFSPEFIATLKSKLPISEIVGKRVPIKRHGREFQGLCPFHKEKSPSFTVNDEKGFFHCFGCGAHGDAVGFIKDFEKINYDAAVIRLAKEAGIPLPASNALNTATTDNKTSEDKSAEGLFAFVLMPFSSEFDDVYKLGIKEPASKLGIRAERVDEQIYNEGILERIYRQIDLADIIIADMTGQNPNVFYEVGYAHAKEKLCILLTSNSEDIPFDLKHKRHVLYKGSLANLQKSMLAELEWAKNEKEKIKDSRITATLKGIDTDLEKSKYQAFANLTFKIELLNETSKASPDIEFAYFYTGPDWTLFQDGKECHSKESSDFEEATTCHLINVPIHKLRKGQWAHIIFQAKKRVWNGIYGEQEKDKYRIHGEATLRVVTTEGNFDYEFPISVEASEIPF